MALGSLQLGSLQFVNPHLSRPGWTYVLVPATRPRPLPVADRPVRLDLTLVGAGRTMSLDEFHSETATTSLSVLVGGTLVYESYPAGAGRADLFLGASATKSLLAHLVGRAMRSGAMGLDDVAGVLVPELAGTGYGTVRVRDLITMTSGVDWVEDHRDPLGPATELITSFAGAGSSRALLGRVRARSAPGTRYEYCTADSQVLDWVRERATGIAFAEATAELWREMGCTADAAVAVDGDGVALAGGGLAAAATDWARIGLLQVDGTLAGGERLLDHAWVEDGSRPMLPFLAPGRLPSSLSTHVGFGYHWWPLGICGRRVSADGSRGQFVYVDRQRDVVVVKTSAWAYSDPVRDRQCRDLSYLALPVIAETAHRSASLRQGVPS